MKLYFLFLPAIIFCSASSHAQYRTSDARSWDRFPPEVQQRGFGLHKSQIVQMDDDAELEEVFLFSSDNGHYPYFDIFKLYYIIVGYHTKEIKYRSDIVLSTERSLLLEDRNNDGRMELYRRYFKDGMFSTDEDGNKLSVQWVYDDISFNQ